MLLQCMAGHQRTLPSVALEYGVMLAHEVETVCAAVFEVVSGAEK